jgi:hypothetical protein
MNRHTASLRAACLPFVFLSACGAEGPATPLSEAVSEAVTATKKAVDDLIDEANAWADEEPLALRRHKCEEEHGKLVEVLKVSACEAGEVTLVADGTVLVQSCEGGTGGPREHQCAHFDAAGLMYFNDGPSTPSWVHSGSPVLGDSLSHSRWARLFWPAAVNHDYCYHHNGSTYGYTQADCDDQLYRDLSALCAEQSWTAIHWFSKLGCQVNAAGMYAAVRKEGEESWEAMDARVAYPNWVPIWQTLGMDADPTDDTLAREIDKLAQKL